MSRKVLLVAYHWPPANSAGAHRPLRFARHLRQFGWEPVILTAEPIRYERYDADLLQKVPEGVQVIRAPHCDPWLSFKARRADRLARAQTQAPGVVEARPVRSGVRAWPRRFIEWAQPRAYHPDLFAGWIGPAVQAAQQRFTAGEFGAIWATGGPWSDFEVGYRLARAWGTPLLLDFRDGWTLADDAHSAHRPGWARRGDRARLARYFDLAQAVLLLHGGYAEAYLAAYPGLEARKIHLIPNGLEPGEVNQQPTPPRGDYLNMLYVGTLHGRKYDTLLTALAQAHREQPLPIQLTFIGESWQPVKEMAEQLGVSGLLNFLDPQPQRAVLEQLTNAHVLLLLGETPQPGYELYVASKTFQYLAMRRAVLGVLPPNETNRVLRRLGAGLVADALSVEQVKAALLTLGQAWQTDSLEKYVPDESALAEFIEPGPTEALALALENKPPRRPYRRGLAALPASLEMAHQAGPGGGRG